MGRSRLRSSPRLSTSSPSSPGPARMQQGMDGRNTGATSGPYRMLSLEPTSGGPDSRSFNMTSLEGDAVDNGD
eukprot:4258726-Pyramimonas_sp.AAC.1